MLLFLVWGITLLCDVSADSEAFVREGDKEFISAKYDKAIDLYTSAINEDSSNYRAYYKRANVYIQKKSYRQALFDLSQVLNLNSDYHLAIQSRAKVQQELGNWEESIEDLKKVKKLKPDLATKIDAQIKEVSILQTLISQGDSLFKLSKWQEAKVPYGQVLEQASGMSAIRLKRALCSYNLGSFSEVLDDTMRILKSDKSNVEAIYLRGNAFRQLGEVDAALLHYKSCVKFSSANTDCKTAQKELDGFQTERNSAKTNSQHASTAKKAIEQIDNCLKYIVKEKLDYFREEMLLTKCKSYVSLKEAEQALSACENIGGNEAHKLRGEAYIILQKYEEAVREYQKAVDGGDQSAHGGLQNAQRLLKISKRKDYYKILEIPNTASPKEIKRAYHKMALKWHPDKNPDEKEKAELKLQDINEANAVLSDPSKKERYDRGEDLDERPGHGFHGFEGGNPFQGFTFNFGRRG